MSGGTPARSKAPRAPSATRERILDAGLRLFNEQGVQHVTTNHIAAEAGISPGNLYYHYRHKEDIVLELYRRYELKAAGVLNVPDRQQVSIDDLWLLVHMAFEVIQDYRFLFRDLSDLNAEYPSLRARFVLNLEGGIQRTESFLMQLAADGQLDATAMEVRALAVNMVLVSTYWLALQAVRHDAERATGTRDEDLSRGVYQVLSLITPYLEGPARTAMRIEARRYVNA
jgi:AcrR family transcriptional regulator